MRFTKPRLMILALPLMLVACGDGWESHRTDKIFPYGNKRTAGSGVMYVRANMMPEKELKLTPASEKLEQQLYSPKTNYKPATDDRPVSVGEIEMPEDAQPSKMAAAVDEDTESLEPQMHAGLTPMLDDIEPASGQETSTITATAEAENFVQSEAIIVPKNQTYQPLSEGEQRLNEIYHDDPYVER